jgi:hypothetical protein
MANKGKSQRVIGIFSLKGIKGESAIKIKHLETGTLEDGQSIKDTKIHKYEIAPHIVAEIYACNITDYSLMSSRKQPMLYTTIAMVKPFKMAILCTITLYFTIEDEVKSREQFLKSKLYGKFSLEITMQGVSKPLDHEISTFPGNEKLVELLEGLTTNESMVTILQEIANVEEAKISSKYVEDFDYFTLPKNIISLRDVKLDDDDYDSLSDDDSYESEQNEPDSIEV